MNTKIFLIRAPKVFGLARFLDLATFGSPRFHCTLVKDDYYM